MSAYAARYRAARGWADLNQQDLADRLGLEKQVIVRTEGGSRDPKLGELIAVAAVCGVPEEFMVDGFGRVERDELLDRLERIEAALSDGLNGQRQAIVDLMSTVAPGEPSAEDEPSTPPEEDDPPNLAGGRQPLR